MTREDYSTWLRMGAAATSLGVSYTTLRVAVVNGDIISVVRDGHRLVDPVSALRWDRQRKDFVQTLGKRRAMIREFSNLRTVLSKAIESVDLLQAQFATGDLLLERLRFLASITALPATNGSEPHPVSDTP